MLDLLAAVQRWLNQGIAADLGAFAETRNWAALLAVAPLGVRRGPCADARPRQEHPGQLPGWVAAAACTLAGGGERAVAASCGLGCRPGAGGRAADHSHSGLERRTSAGAR